VYQHCAAESQSINKIILETPSPSIQSAEYFAHCASVRELALHTPLQLFGAWWMCVNISR
jgi:hypothetical protein